MLDAHIPATGQPDPNTGTVHRLDYAAIITNLQDQLDDLRSVLTVHQQLFEQLVASGVLTAAALPPLPER